MTSFRRIAGPVLALAFAVAAAFSAVSADEAPQLQVTAGGQTSTYTLAEFAALPRSELKTVTPFMDGEQHFEGVLLSDLLKAVGVTQPVDLAAAALDDYSVVISAADQAKVAILVADRQNGAPLDLDGMGPFWIIYPADSGVEKAQDRMIWQLKSLTAK